ncbi:MAG: altronate dehydratase [Pedosphaera sp.]|nr:altronate dehydratase [Pedosphaera sp.]MSU42970.1 altronate dehydratase [Pedosphaera sp.]
MVSTNESPILQLREGDHVAVAKRTIKAGTRLECHGRALTAAVTIPAGHKIAISNVEADAPVLKYGQVIGFAQIPIACGDHVHSHNLVMRNYERQHAFCADYRPAVLHPEAARRTFQGYARPGGRAGTRNYVAIISNVNCSASVARYVTERFRGPDFHRDFPNVDGVIAFKTQGGCGVDPGGPMRIIRRTLGNMARHPNIAAYVMIGLGCEDNQIRGIREDHALDTLKPGEIAPAYMTIQGTGGTRKTIDAAAAAVLKVLPQANDARRSEQALAKLLLAENCGGSDGNSGITANPALGVASDELVRHGGTSVLAETTEIYGAEHLLTRRAARPEVAEKLMRQIHWWEDYARRHDSSIDNNPSVGNKEGGLTTIYEKSLGAVSKGGQSPLMAVYDYAEAITEQGFCFMDTPGYDPVSMTGLVAGGCNVGVFTTGRGSVYGCKPSPCLKIATNTTLFQWMEEDMDINAGTILDGTETVEQVGRKIFEKIIAVASGEKTKSELLGIGDEEFQPWFPGPQY